MRDRKIFNKRAGKLIPALFCLVLTLKNTIWIVSIQPAND